ncbi:MAG: hypothetical protein ACFFA3_05710 [Promethearchaeota archaeon]
MLIREAGIIFNGMPIIYSSYHRASKEHTDLICSSGLLSGLFTFAGCLMEPIEYFETSKYSLVFRTRMIEDFYGEEQEILSFLVLDKDARLEKYLNRSVKPLLDKLLKKFISDYNGCKLNDASLFEPFRATIDKIFGTGTMTLEEKVLTLLM